MATRNDYLLLEQKCLKHYQLALPYLRSKKGKQEFPKEMQARFGFYYFILKLYTELSEHSDITKIITDTDFNAKFFDKPDSDEGIDAVYVDEENNHIQLFNFKYRFPFKPEAVQSKDEALKSSKFFSVLLTQKNKLKGRMKEEASRIIELLNGNETWDISFYIVSNENNTLKIDDPNLEQLKEIYGVKIIGIGLNEIVEETSPRPRQIDATLLLPKDSIMTFKEDSLSSNISYIMTLPLVELIRITCNDESVRDLYNWEDGKILEKVKKNNAIAIVDPVMGDDGKKYVSHDEEMCDKMRDIVKIADIITPNLTEACILLDEDYNQISQICDYELLVTKLEYLIDKFIAWGVKKVVITGIEHNNNILNVAKECGKDIQVFSNEKIGISRAGTGDVFASVIAADAVKGLPLEESVRRAAGFVSRAISISEKRGIPEQDGLCFEELLSISQD
jgi:hypothetical protein